jgi:hypothetical protein
MHPVFFLSASFFMVVIDAGKVIILYVKEKVAANRS